MVGHSLNTFPTDGEWWVRPDQGRGCLSCLAQGTIGVKDYDPRLVNRIVLAFLSPESFHVVANNVEDLAKGLDAEQIFRFVPEEIARARLDRNVIAQSYKLMKYKSKFVVSEIESKCQWLFQILDTETVEDLGW